MRNVFRPIVVSATAIALASQLAVGGAHAAEASTVPTTSQTHLQAIDEVVTLTAEDRTAINVSLQAQGFTPLPGEVNG